MLLTTTNFSAALLCLISAALAQNLTFVRPRFSTFQTNDNGIPQFIVGDNVTIEWESDFQYSTLFVYQEIATNVFQSDVLAQGARRDKIKIGWKVGALAGSEGPGGSFHFELRNAVDEDCEGCSLNSENFVVSRRQSANSTASPSTTARAATSSVQSAGPTTSGRPTAAVAGAQSTTPSGSTAAGGSNDGLRIGLGVGLGIGIPLFVAALGLLFCMRRRRTRRNSLPRGRQPSPARSPDRTSGAWLYQDGRQSQQSMLFRPSTTATRSEMSSWSHRSWIEPFEFEQSETRDQDAMSQLRQSIYSNSRFSRLSQVSLSDVRSEERGGTLEGIPEQPQAVHHDGWGRTLL